MKTNNNATDNKEQITKAYIEDAEQWTEDQEEYKTGSSEELDLYEIGEHKVCVVTVNGDDIHVDEWTDDEWLAISQVVNGEGVLVDDEDYYGNQIAPNGYIVSGEEPSAWLPDYDAIEEKAMRTHDIPKKEMLYWDWWCDNPDVKLISSKDNEDEEGYGFDSLIERIYEYEGKQYFVARGGANTRYREPEYKGSRSYVNGTLIESMEKHKSREF